MADPEGEQGNKLISSIKVFYQSLRDHPLRAIWTFIVGIGVIVGIIAGIFAIIAGISGNSLTRPNGSIAVIPTATTAQPTPTVISPPTFTPTAFNSATTTPTDQPAPAITATPVSTAGTSAYNIAGNWVAHTGDAFNSTSWYLNLNQSGTAISGGGSYIPTGSQINFNANGSINADTVTLTAVVKNSTNGASSIGSCSSTIIGIKLQVNAQAGALIGAFDPCANSGTLTFTPEQGP